MNHDRPADFGQQRPVAPVIGVGDGVLHRHIVGTRPFLGPVPLSFPVTRRSGTDANQSAALDHDRSGQRVGTTQVDAQGLDHQTRETKRPERSPSPTAAEQYMWSTTPS